MLKTSILNLRCYICDESLSTKSGVIAADNFVRNSLVPIVSKYKSLDDVLNSKYKCLVDTITFEYFQQFKDIYNQKRKIEDLAHYFKEDMNICRNPKYRLEKVLKDPPEKFLFLLCHDDCLYNPYYYYQITIDRINTPRKAIEWTLHLGEKYWFNHKGWNRILESLFGRISV